MLTLTRKLFDKNKEKKVQPKPNKGPNGEAEATDKQINESRICRKCSGEKINKGKFVKRDGTNKPDHIKEPQETKRQEESTEQSQQDNDRTNKDKICNTVK